MQCIRDSVVESVISLILESCNHANHATQVQHDVVLALFQWQAPLCPAGSTVTRAARDRPHLELFKSTVKSGSLEKQAIPARPNSIDVRVGDKLKVVQFHPVIRKRVDSITQNNKLRLAPTRCSLDSQYVHIRCPLPVKNTKKPGQRTNGRRQSRCSLDSHYVTNHTLTVREGVITQSHAKSPGAPQTSTLSLCLIEQFDVMLGTVPRHSIRCHLLVPRHSIRGHLLSSTFSLSSARRFPKRINPSNGGDTKFSHSVLDEMAVNQNGLSQVREAKGHRMASTLPVQRDLGKVGGEWDATAVTTSDVTIERQ